MNWEQDKDLPIAEFAEKHCLVFDCLVMKLIETEARRRFGLNVFVIDPPLSLEYSYGVRFFIDGSSLTGWINFGETINQYTIRQFAAKVQMGIAEMVRGKKKQAQSRRFPSTSAIRSDLGGRIDHVIKSAVQGFRLAFRRDMNALERKLLAA